MVIKCSDENLRGMVRDAESLRDDVKDVSYYAGYYIIAEDSESEKEVCIAINKWFEKDPDFIGKVNRWFDIYIMCDDVDALESVWSIWDGTEIQDPDELFNVLKEIRDNITEESFNAD